MKKNVFIFLALILGSQHIHGMFGLFGQNTEARDRELATRLFIQKLETDLKQSKNNLNETTEQLVSAKQKLKEIKNEHKKCQDRIDATFKAFVETVNKQVDLECKIKEAGEEIKSCKLDTELKVQQAKAEAEEKLTQLDEIIQEKAIYNKKLEDEKEELGVQVEKLVVDLVEANLKNQTLNDEKNTLEHAIEQLQAEQQEHGAKVTTLSSQLEAVSTQLEVARNENNELKEQNKIIENSQQELLQKTQEYEHQLNDLMMYKNFMYDHLITRLELPGENDALWLQDYENGKGWFTLDNLIRNTYFNTEYVTDHDCSVELVKCFIPDECDNLSEKVVISMVHGTFVHADDYLPGKKDIKKEEGKIFRALIGYAQSKAAEFNKPVVLWVFKWDGSNSQEGRIKGGKSYAKIHNRFFSLPQWYDTHIAHSHGGNVITYASGKLWRKAKKVYLFATPPRAGEDKRFEPRNIEQLILFWTDLDLVQVLGSLKADSYTALLMSPFDQNSSRKLKNDTADVRNTRVLIDGWGCGHSSIKNVLWVLAEVEKKIAEDFPYHADLQLNLITKPEIQAQFRDKKLLMAVRGEQLAWNIVEKNAAIQKAVNNSLKHSNNIKKIFEEQYGYEMDVKSGYFAQLVFGLLTNNNRPIKGWNEQTDLHDDAISTYTPEDTQALAKLLNSQFGSDQKVKSIFDAEVKELSESDLQQLRQDCERIINDQGWAFMSLTGSQIDEN